MAELIFNGPNIIEQKISLISCAAALYKLDFWGYEVKDHNDITGTYLVKFDVDILATVDRESKTPCLSDRMKIAIAAIANDDQASWSVLADYLAESMFQDR